MIETTQDLLELLSPSKEKYQKEDITQFKYVIYARKSTGDEERQIRSIPDQIVECLRLADAKLLTVVKMFKESESAKEPDIRPVFRQVINGIKEGKYDGIIAWHPDRLARNMKDAGEIIDLLDKKTILDLQFCSFTFENNTAGKMLLGIAFVLSKQYSDKLSDDVKRGTRRSIEDGKWLNKAKHGYYKNRNQYLIPDKINFPLLKSAWKMRLENYTLDDIATYLNELHYAKAEGIGGEHHKKFKMDKKTLSKIFRDTFYTGVMQYSETIVDLNKIYDFTPMIEVSDFMKINKISDLTKIIKQKIKASKNNIKSELMQGMVKCGYCGNVRSTGLTSKQSKERKVYTFTIVVRIRVVNTTIDLIELILYLILSTSI